MLKLSRSSEYGLMALNALAGLPSGQSISARQLAQRLGAPEELLAKILQCLKNSHLVASNPGVRGGYSIGKSFFSMSFLGFLERTEGPVGAVPCARLEPCTFSESCQIIYGIKDLNREIYDILHRRSLRSVVTPFVFRSQALGAEP